MTVELVAVATAAARDAINTRVTDGYCRHCDTVAAGVGAAVLAAVGPAVLEEAAQRWALDERDIVPWAVVVEMLIAMAAELRHSTRRATENHMDFRRTAELLGEIFPVDGPHTDLQTANAALCLRELVRYLVNATNSTGGVTHPSTVTDVLGGVAAALEELRQPLRQLGQVTVDLSRQPNSAHETTPLIYRDLARWPLKESPAATGDEVAETLLIVEGALTTAAHVLRDAQAYAGRLKTAPRRPTPEG